MDMMKNLRKLITKNNEKKMYEKIRKQKIHGAYDMSYETNISDTKIIIFGVVFITSFFLGVAFLVNTIMPWFWNIIFRKRNCNNGLISSNCYINSYDFPNI